LPFTQASNFSTSIISRKEIMKNKRNWLSDEAGDVPGWVLITLMTAGLVVLMWGVAGPALKGVFEQALNKVVTF
jgi:hypothetical protein